MPLNVARALQTAAGSPLMAAQPDAAGHVDLRALDLRAGEAESLAIGVPPSTVVIGGSRYELQIDGDLATIDVNHAHAGWHLRVRAAGALRGPCWRCLQDATLALRADVSEFARFERPAGAPFDEDLDSEYLSGDGLDALGMARDALLDGVPNTILCRDDCAGLCATCGVNLTAGPCGCPPPAPDSRWDALREVAERLETER